MSEVLVAPDVEQLLIDYLTAALIARDAPTPVGGQVPNPRPPSSVQVILTGGATLTRVTISPQVTIDCRATLKSQAARLANLTSGLMGAADGAMLSGRMIYRVTAFALPASLPDPLTPGEYRYRQTFSVDVRITAI